MPALPVEMEAAETAAAVFLAGGATYGGTVWPTSTLLRSEVHEAWVWIGATVPGAKNQPFRDESRATVPV